MTGMGRARGKIGASHFLVEIKSVNHRYCEVNPRFPPRLQSLEIPLVALIKKKISRGKIDIWIGEEKGVGAVFSVNEKALKGYYALLQTIRKKLKIKGEITLENLQQGSHLWGESSPDAARFLPGLKKLAEAALNDLIRMREKEGSHLKQSLLVRLKNLEKIRILVGEKSPLFLEVYRDKLKARLSKILGESTEVDQARLSQEIIFHADRCDVSEELERLSSHFEQLKTLLSQKESAGRPLDFLIQEMNREWNTIASKSPDAEVSHLVVEAKSEMEKMREQVQNVE